MKPEFRLVTEIDEIIEGCINQQRQAQGRFYSLLSGKILGICRRYLQNNDDAEDAMQDVFVKIFTQIKKYRKQGPVEAWARRIAVNRCLDVLKKRKRIVFDSGMSLLENISLEEEQAEEIDTVTLLACIKKLPDGYRALVNLYAIEDYSHAEIAGLLNIKESTSRSQYSRARQQLLKLLKECNVQESLKKA